MSSHSISSPNVAAPTADELHQLRSQVAYLKKLVSRYELALRTISWHSAQTLDPAPSPET